MRNILSNHSEVAHYWANDVQEKGEGCNMFFTNRTIYSYGYHFPIAKKINIRGTELILFTTSSYSVSTAKHISITRQAIPYGCEILSIPIVDFDVKYTDMATHINNVQYFIESIKGNLQKAKRARKYKASYLQDVLSLKTSLRRYLELFRVKSKLAHSLKKLIDLYLNANDSTINDAIHAENEIQAKQAKIRVAKQAKKLNEMIPKWKANEINSLPYHDKQLLRLTKNNEIETSLHVKISIDIFKKYNDKLKKGLSLIGDKITYYKVLKQDDKLITIGCHRIPISEVNYIDSLVN
jgi:hypothetical protein